MYTALIVEDDADQAGLLARLVRLRDYKPVVAATGQEGLELARSLQPDLMLLDLMLPDRDGFDLCLQLRGEPHTRTIPIVMVTALGSDDHRRRGLTVGANAYVGKPFGADDLFEAIASARAWKARLERTQVRGEIHLEIRSETAFLEEVNDFIGHLCRETPLTSEQINQLRQAVMEIGQNAIEWGNRHCSEELVRITYRVCEDRVEVIVTDQGPGFDPEHLPHAARPDDPLAHLDLREKLGLREGGFGLMICRGMLDELRHNPRGNEVTLVKRFATPVRPVPPLSRA